MRVAVISCWNYRDCWSPFVRLARRFWPDCPYPLDLITDTMDIESDYEPPHEIDRLYIAHEYSWGETLAHYAREATEPIVLLQEDFLLTAPVHQNLIEHGLTEMLKLDAGCARLYPCPGSDADYGDPCFGIVNRGSRYRVSLQTAWWQPRYLLSIAQRYHTPAEFELDGTVYSDELPQEVLAFKRDCQPWPLSYLCSAVGRGKWSQDAKRLCNEYQIEVDWSMRPVDEPVNL